MKYSVRPIEGMHYTWMARQFLLPFVDVEDRLESFDEVTIWCGQHLADLSWYGSSYEYRFYFTDIDTAMAFKMRWC